MTIPTPRNIRLVFFAINPIFKANKKFERLKMKKVTKSDTSQTEQERENYNFFDQIIKHANIQAQQIILTLGIWHLNHGNEIPSIDSYTSISPKWPPTVTEIYHWPVKTTRRVTGSSVLNVTLLIQHGVAQKALVGRWYMGRYEWYVLDRDAYKNLLTSYGLAESSFGPWKTVVEVRRQRADIVRGIKTAKVSR